MTYLLHRAFYNFLVKWLYAIVFSPVLKSIKMFLNAVPCHGLQESKKWQERKEALDALLKLAEAPKIENADYHELIRILKKVFVIVLIL